jgi:hypothetical protein
MCRYLVFYILVANIIILILFVRKLSGVNSYIFFLLNSNNQFAFILFAFDTFGFLAPDTMNILKRVQRLMHSNCYFNSITNARNFIYLQSLLTTEHR